jgi:DNA-binding HxlR family transcriptional regulator
VTRRQYEEIPARVEYSLTPRGRDLAPIIAEMVRWSERWGRRAGASTEPTAS